MAACSKIFFDAENKSDTYGNNNNTIPRLSAHCALNPHPRVLNAVDSIIVLPESMVFHVCTYLDYGDFNNFVKSNKTILAACIPSWQHLKNKNKNRNNSNNDNNRGMCVYNDINRNEFERGLVNNDESLSVTVKYTRSMARTQCDNLTNASTRFHSGNIDNNNNNNHNIGNIDSIIRNEFDMLYQDMKTVIPALICQFENDPKLINVTMGLNDLNDHLGSINHSKYACILEFIDLIFYLISKRKVNSFNDCIKQILHKLAIGNDYKLSLLTIIERYGKVELSEITLEKASGIGNIEDTDDIFGG